MVDQAERLRQIIRDSHKQAQSPTLDNLVTVFGGRSKMGVTSVTVNLALALARRNQRVVMVDLNFSNPQLADFCRIKLPIHRLATLLETGLGRELLHSGPCGVEILPLKISPNQSPAQMSRLGSHVEECCHALDSSHTIIVDAGWELNHVNRSICRISSDVIVLTNETPQSIVECYATIKSIGLDKTSARIHTVVNRSKSDAGARDVHERISLSCDRFLNLDVRELGTISHDVKFTEAMKVGRPLLLHTPHGSTALQLNDLAEMLQLRMRRSQRRKVA